MTTLATWPSAVRNEFSGELDENVTTEILKKIPLADFCDPEEIATLALYLAGPEARYITGQVVAIDGGMTM